MSEETTTTDNPAIDIDSAVETLGTELTPEAPAPETPPAPTAPQSANPNIGKGLPEGSAWGGEPVEKPGEPAEPREPANPDPPFDANALSGEQIDQLLQQRWGLEKVDGIKSLRQAYDEAKTKIQELESRPADSGEVEKLRQEYEAIDRIRNSEAWDKDVMAPQADALAKAQEIGKSANLEDYQVSDLFAAQNAYQVEQQLGELNDPAAANLLRPLALSALEAREKGVAATKAQNPLEELQNWINRSRQIQSQQDKQLSQQDLQVNLEALDSAFAGSIEQTPIGRTAIAGQIRESIKQEIQNGIPMETGDVWEGRFWQRLAPITNGLLAKQAAEISQLKSELSRVGGLPDNRPSPTPPATGNRVAVTGGLPQGTAWGG